MSDEENLENGGKDNNGDTKMASKSPKMEKPDEDPLQLEPEADADGDVRRSVRPRTLTEKGLAYLLDSKQKRRQQLYRQLVKKTEYLRSRLIEDVSLSEIQMTFSHWLTMYENFRDAYDDYYILLPKDEQRDDVDNWFEEKDEYLQNFKDNIEQWIMKYKSTLDQNFISTQRQFQHIVEASIHKEPDEKMSPAGSHVSTRKTSTHLTSVSTHLSSAKIREEQKKAELTVRAATLKKKQALEMAKLKLKMQEEELELESQMAISDAKTKALTQFQPSEQQQQRSRLQTSATSAEAHVRSKYQQHQKNMNSTTCAQENLPCSTGFYNTGQDTQQCPELNPNVSPFIPRVNNVVVPETVQCRKPYVKHDHDNDVCSSASHNSQKSTEEVISAVVRQLRKPTAEIQKFGGDPVEYKKFMRQFRTRVVLNAEDDDEKLNYLEQYTTGEAHKIVNGLSYLDAKIGYRAALKELDERYGDPDVIVNAFVKRALNWPFIKSDNPKALDEFAIFLSECENAAQSIEAIRILEYSENMKKIVSKLPYHLHEKWRSIVHEAKGKAHVVQLHDLVTFVKKEAKKANDPIYGREALSQEHPSGKGDKGRTAKVSQSNRPKGSFATKITDSKVEPKEDDLLRTRAESLKASNDSVVESTQSASHKGSDRSCVLCGNTQHALSTCKQFTDLPFKDKADIVKAKGVCFGCLKPGHMKKDCRNKSVCKHCQKRHPTVMHMEPKDFPKRTTEDNTLQTSAKTHTMASINLSTVPKGLAGTKDDSCTLAIIPVKVRMKGGLREVETYAFLDPGSNVTFCTESLMHQITGTGRRMKITLETMGQPHTMSTYAVTGMEVSDLQSEHCIELPRVYTKDKMPVTQKHIPTNKDISGWTHLKDIQLPQIDADVGLLIGNNVPDAYTPVDVRSGPRSSPHATKTLLGWITWNVIRDVDMSISANSLSVNRVEIAAIEEVEEHQQLDKLVKQYINLDFPERGIDDRREHSQEDKLFLEKVNDSIEYKDGHFEIALPFRNDCLKLLDNQEQAKQRLRSLKQKFIKNPRFKEDYETFMTSIITKDYAEKVPAEEIYRNDGRVWYIPHHGVYHTKKPEKIRVVFDCSATYRGVSLNQVLLPGPDLTCNLLDVLINFREETVAVMADIESMFYQVRIPKEDSDCLRFYWWTDGNLDSVPEVYRMKVHLFGAASSPSCSSFALRRAAEHSRGQFADAAVDSVFSSFYVDDYLRSVDSKEVAISLIRDVTAICQGGGFHLTKWISSSRTVLETVPTDERAKDVKSLNLDCDKLPVERALGVYWSVDSDTLGFSISIQDRTPTRRVLLSDISSVYDPLGFVAPLLLPAKILLQDLCHREVGWDEVITGEDLRIWQSWLHEIPRLSVVAVPRCFKPATFGKISSCQMHIFCDASERGYGIVCYLRIVDESSKIHCSFVIGKSRVAPLKKITIPRMELTAATVAVRMKRKLEDLIHYDVDAVLFWTDSQTVLRYIANKKTRFHTFVANRLSVIHEGSDVQNWRYVESKLNPADDASRGLTVDTFLQSQNWFRGPDFLWKPESEWPNHTELGTNDSENDPEVRKVAVATIKEDKPSPTDELLSYFSEWKRLKKTVAWLLVARRTLQSWAKKRKELRQNLLKDVTDTAEVEHKVDRAMKKIRDTNSVLRHNLKDIPLSDSILDEAETEIYRYVQKQAFTREIKSLETRKGLTKDSSLRRLDPILVDGILRVGGRLDRAVMSYDAKHPIILPKDSPISKLILEETHRSVGHMGKNTMLARLRQKHWIVRANHAIKSITSKCVICRKYQAKGGDQKMADLPFDRVVPDEPPFTRVGMDYFGPIEVKRGRSVVKRYGVIFTCLTIRAVHLELAFSLDTDSCVSAIRRFIARRGPVRIIRSDNGTNLVGAQRELKEEINKWNELAIHDTFRQEGIIWKFNPPTGSHFGGVWERLIRYVRKILYSLFKQQMVRLDDESLMTLLCEVEAILNGRPITKVSQDPNDLGALTPNHLLLMQPGESLPCGTFDKDDNYARRRWRQVQYLSDIFWKRWSKEYLSVLQERQKWHQVKRNLAPGDVVLLIDSTPRSAWLLGKVLNVNKDSRGLVRSAAVKTKTNVLQRPVDKLCLILEADCS